MSQRRRRERMGKVFEGIALAATIFGLLVLALLLLDVARRGLGTLSWSFLTSYPSRFPEQAGIRSALLGTLWMMGLTALFAVPLGVAATIYLEEYAPRNQLTRLIELNINNLAGVPSIIYGLLGLELFVRAMRLERSILAGALTLSLLVLPILITASREALRAVPMSLREAAFALGATRWQVIRHQVLPVAFPGILTGMILALSRAIGETAPLITIGALAFIPFDPKSPFDPFTVLPIQIFNWISRPQAGFHARAAGAILVLLAVLLSMNGLAIYLRYRLQRRYQW
ncbi:phosphate ABC transporter permease PstA [Thermoflexus sp.]|uniref:phosphate ABC transporter permease PstA n=1 Tax=Thermoflexus sp. TaxID=1969742 RepID=UPI0035E4625D